MRLLCGCLCWFFSGYWLLVSGMYCSDDDVGICEGYLSRYFDHPQCNSESQSDLAFANYKPLSLSIAKSQEFGVFSIPGPERTSLFSKSTARVRSNKNKEKAFIVL
mmetsp:Transcript_12102/g.15648  ORF Transcript_12102/g.15648 Transcript_12102/m.15648 type:complete len:106 (-) Transcript_12102:87-404(-)